MASPLVDATTVLVLVLEVLVSVVAVSVVVVVVVVEVVEEVEVAVMLDLAWRLGTIAGMSEVEKEEEGEGV